MVLQPVVFGCKLKKMNSPKTGKRRRWLARPRGGGGFLSALAGMTLALGLFFCAGLAVAGDAVAAPPGTPLAAGKECGYLIKVRDVDSGLPDSSITCIAQTPDGYLWVGTSVGGLSRFDGQRFVNFYPGNTPGLTSSQIQTLIVDAQGTLWIGAVDGALFSYADGRFHLERQSPEVAGGFLTRLLMSSSNSVVFSTIDGRLLSGTRLNGTNQWTMIQPPDAGLNIISYAVSQGVIWYRAANGSLGQVHDGKFVALPDPPGLQGAMVTALIADPAGRLWVGTAKGLAQWSGKSFADMTPTNGEPGLRVEQIAPCSDGSLWVWTDQGLRKCRGRQWVARVESWDGAGPSSKDLSFSPLGHLPLNLHVDSQGGLWVSHYGDGLWHVDAGGQVLQIRETQGLPNALVECWQEDREGNIWLGLNGGGGLISLRPRFFHNLWPAEAFAHEAVWSVCEDQTGAMWFGTSGGVLRHRPGGEFSWIAPPVMTGKAWRDVRVCADAVGRLWVGCVGNGVVTLADGKFDRPFPADDIGTVARVLYLDRVGRIWIGSEFGLFCWDQGRLKRFRKADGFTPAYVMSITEDPAGNMWFGTALGELRRYQNGTFTSYWPKDSRTEPQRIAAAAAAEEGATPLQNRSLGVQIGSDRFSALFADAGDVIWIGSLGGGLLRFQDGQFTRYTRLNGLPNDNVSQILKDNRGQLWLGTREGITRVNLAELNRFAKGQSPFEPFVTYGKDDGLPTLQCSDSSQPACWRARDGNLWFGTLKGALWVDPETLPVNRVPPLVVIEDVSVDGQTQAGADGRLPARLRIPPGRHYFDFKFTASSFTSPDKVLFQWRLAGLEKDWVPATTRRSVNYSYVPPGDYEFQVRACNNDGVWNETGVTIKLTVLPYFWQTRWFQAGAAGFGLLSMLGVGFSVQRRRYRARMLVLERRNALEQERTRIARDIHDQVGSNLTKISMQTDMLGREPGIVATAQPLIQGVAETTREMLHSMDEIVWAINPRNDTLENTVNYLIHYTREFLRPSGIAYKLDLPVDLPARSISAEIRHNLFMAFKEALNNAVKHGRPGSIRLELGLEPRQFRLVVADDGCGFTPGARRAGADGLENMRQRLKSVGGDCQVESAPGRGTRVTFQLPLEFPAGPATHLHAY